jgi:hypothetical protein
MDAAVRAEYDERLAELRAEWEHSDLRHKGAAGALVLIAALVFGLGVSAVRRQVPVWWPAMPIPLGVVAAAEFRRLRAGRSRIWRAIRYYDRSLRRVNGHWTGNGYRGGEFDRDDHPYARDLGIFGEGSLFELLCVARTAIGRRRLAEWLLEAPPVEETTARQEAVRALEKRADVREAVAGLGAYEFSESSWETLAVWLNAAPVVFPGWLRVAAAITSSLTACGILAAALGAVPWLQAARWVEPLLLLQAAAGLAVRTKVARVLDATGPVSDEIAVLRDGVALLERERLGVVGAARTLGALRRLLTLLEQRDKDWFNLLFLVFMGKTQLCMAIERWRAKHGAQLRDWIDAWGDFEALNALATYAHENPDAVFPEVTEGEARIEATGLGHPLLPNEGCVRNDVVLDERTRFFVISGSNMSGKSTLLRAIGLNAVLAYAGAPVRVRSLHLARMNVCASLAVLDSLLNGRSRFLAEVERLRLTIELAAGNAPVLFLVDEIFSGTNSRDRRAAAEAVVRTLVDRRAVGALSTHDMSLTEIAQAPGLGGANVHMGSREAGDPMDFDYLLKPGVTQETNALAIARMAGVPI